MAKTWMIVVGIILIILFIMPFIFATNLIIQWQGLARNFAYLMLGIWIFVSLMLILGILLLVMGIKKD